MKELLVVLEDQLHARGVELGLGMRWCPQWWRHPEAVSWLEALWARTPPDSGIRGVRRGWVGGRRAGYRGHRRPHGAHPPRRHRAGRVRAQLPDTTSLRGPSGARECLLDHRVQRRHPTAGGAATSGSAAGADDAEATVRGEQPDRMSGAGRTVAALGQESQHPCPACCAGNLGDVLVALPGQRDAVAFVELATALAEIARVGRGEAAQAGGPRPIKRLSCKRGDLTPGHDPME